MNSWQELAELEHVESAANAAFAAALQKFVSTTILLFLKLVSSLHPSKSAMGGPQVVGSGEAEKMSDGAVMSADQNQILIELLSQLVA
jgi:hypothetical protein